MLLSLAILFSAGAGSAAAAGGTSPTRFDTGTVTCRLDLINSTSTINAFRPVMRTAGTSFNGYFAASSKLQFSEDRGQTWNTWSGTKRSHGRTRVNGSGASVFNNVMWGPWAIPEDYTLYALRVKTIFRWLNRYQELVAKRVRVADYYRTETYVPGNPFAQVTTSTVGCVLLLA